MINFRGVPRQDELRYEFNSKRFPSPKFHHSKFGLLILSESERKLYANIGISMEEISSKLETDGVVSFRDSYEQLLDVIAERSQALST